MTLVIHHPVFMGKRDFYKLGGHTEKCGHPHPEQRRWSAQINRKRDPTNITGAHRA